MVSRRTLSHSDSKLLHSRSAGRCNICRLDTTEVRRKFGENAHIEPKEIRGPRGTDNRTLEVSSIENHILLCSNHHTEVDTNPQNYPVESLLNLKRNHENWVAASLSQEPWRPLLVDFLKNYVEYSGFRTHGNLFSRSPRIFEFSINRIPVVFQEALDGYGNIFPTRDEDLNQRFRFVLQYFEELLFLINGGENRNKKYIYNYTFIPESRLIVMNEREMNADHAYSLRERVSFVVNNCSTACFDLERYIRYRYPEVL